MLCYRFVAIESEAKRAHDLQVPPHAPACREHTYQVTAWLVVSLLCSQRPEMAWIRQCCCPCWMMAAGLSHRCALLTCAHQLDVHVPHAAFLHAAVPVRRAGGCFPAVPGAPMPAVSSPESCFRAAADLLRRGEAHYHVHWTMPLLRHACSYAWHPTAARLRPPPLEQLPSTEGHSPPPLGAALVSHNHV